MPDFNDNVYALSVEGDKSTGELYFPKEDYSTNMSSGNGSAAPLPEGRYNIKKRIATNEKGIKVGKAGYKYQLVGVTDEGVETTLHKPGKAGHPAVWDPDTKQLRDDLLIHPDGGPAGTLGCVGVRGTPYARGAVTDPTPGSADMNAINHTDGLLDGRNGESQLIVKRFKTQEELDAYKKRQRQLREYPSGISKTNNDASLRNGQHDVLAGAEQRKVAYVGGACIHSQGGQIADGSCSVFVGTGQFKLARKTDPTTDGQVVATGIDSVQAA
jgi:hypothetical protein